MRKDSLARRGLAKASFARELLRVASFVRQCIADAWLVHRRMHETGEARDWEQFQDQAHALKGLASNLGLLQVAALSGALMRMTGCEPRAAMSSRSGTRNHRHAPVGFRG